MSGAALLSAGKLYRVSLHEFALMSEWRTHSQHIRRYTHEGRHALRSQRKRPVATRDRSPDLLVLKPDLGLGRDAHCRDQSEGQRSKDGLRIDCR